MCTRINERFRHHIAFYHHVISEQPHLYIYIYVYIYIYIVKFRIRIEIVFTLNQKFSI